MAKNGKRNFFCGDFIKMNLPKKYDLVFSHPVIDHVYDINMFFAKIIDVCKKYAYISSHLGYFPFLKNHIMNWDKEKGCYFNKLSVNEIKKNLIQNGLDETEFVVRKQEGGNLKDGIENETIIEIDRKF